MAKIQKKAEGVEFGKDAWERFERAVDVVAKSPPQHRTKKPKKTKKGPGEPEPRPRSRQKIDKHRNSPKARG